MSANGMVRPCSCPRQQAKLARGTKDKERANVLRHPIPRSAVIGIDIGKKLVSHVVGHDARAAPSCCGKKWSAWPKWKRGSPMYRLGLIGMEACVGAHNLSRNLASLGHDARLMPAKYVRPYSKGQKNDFNDAEAIAEAVQRPTMKFVATKTAEQLDLQALHRVHVWQPNARINLWTILPVVQQESRCFVGTTFKSTEGVLPLFSMFIAQCPVSDFTVIVDRV